MMLDQNLQLKPVSQPPLDNSPKVQAMATAFSVMTAPEKAQLFLFLESEPGASQVSAARRFDTTWTSFALGAVLGIGGLFAFNHFFARR